QQLPFRLIELVMPYSASIALKSWLAYWVDSIGGRNISTMEVLYGKSKERDARADWAIGDAFARSP
ncbi:hypothetical protein, partial [Variovorax sp. LG9.2]|uniref:hypothetical protein n=1 Tax=Variovorax sp. LG9.2 TaxID=3048626 RepID=UPI002B2255E0